MPLRSVRCSHMLSTWCTSDHPRHAANCRHAQRTIEHASQVCHVETTLAHTGRTSRRLCTFNSVSSGATALRHSHDNPLAPLRTPRRTSCTARRPCALDHRRHWSGVSGTASGSRPGLWRAPRPMRAPHRAALPCVQSTALAACAVQRGGGRPHSDVSSPAASSKIMYDLAMRRGSTPLLPVASTRTPTSMVVCESATGVCAFRGHDNGHDATFGISTASSRRRNTDLERPVHGRVHEHAIANCARSHEVHVRKLCHANLNPAQHYTHSTQSVRSMYP